jgi:hypothetical protein
MLSFTGSYVPSPPAKLRFARFAGEGQGGGASPTADVMWGSPTLALPRKSGRGSYSVLGFWNTRS